MKITHIPTCVCDVRMCVDCVTANSKKDVAECKAQETQQRTECMEWACIYALHSKGGANGDERTKRKK